jgi:hypothetical protein
MSGRAYGLACVPQTWNDPADVRRRRHQLMRYMLGIAAAVLLAIMPEAVRSEPAIPDTLAGRFISVWLKAYNSADMKQIERYNALYSRKCRRRPGSTCTP